MGNGVHYYPSQEMLLQREVLLGLLIIVSRGEEVENVLLKLVLILVATKIGGLISQKLKMPEVLGALFAGVILGPIVLNLVQIDDNIRLLSNLGVILLMFLAGLETDVEQFKKAGASSFGIALLGVLLPLILGTACAFFFFNNIIENLFIGVILTATSVSISVETLNELGKLNTRAGINILGAAVIDDVIGLILISLLIGFTNGSESGSLLSTILGIAAFCVIAISAIVFLPKLINKLLKNIQAGRAILTFALAAAIIAAFLAEKVGIAAITGAYVCGLILSQIHHREYLEHNIKSISSGFLSLIFFASVGLTAARDGLSVEVILITAVMFVIAVIGKIIGCGGAAKLFKLKNSESLQVGVGMMSRGEVAIITANIGLTSGIISQEVFVPTILVVLLTTIVTPVLLKIVFSHHIERRLDRKKIRNISPETV